MGGLSVSRGFRAGGSDSSLYYNFAKTRKAPTAYSTGGQNVKRWLQNSEAILLGGALVVMAIAYLVSRFSN